MASVENRLAREKSPYLLQHAHNPVDWYPWGDAAFEKAKREGKPVLLSVGYSTCHWCHVMEEESFEDPATAKLMNGHFVSIKVDREERPDIDHVYMQYVMATTGGGGWPMTVFLTPDKKPFYGGTYFPPEDRYGMPGFKSLLSSIAQAWKERRNEILASAGSAKEFLDRPKETESASELSEKTLENAFESFAGNYDSSFGGFGRAPKFPMGHSISFLLRYGRRSKDPRALAMAEKTLTMIAHGGLYDSLGGGFHRYSTDPQWRVPHFEKMLYDQAILVRAYLEAYQATHREEYARVARETLDFVLREMTDKRGGFFSAEDADSADPSDPARKREGAFYVWKQAEIHELLGKKEADLFCYHYGIEPHGNALQDPQKEFSGKNVLYVAQSIKVTADRFGLDPSEAERSLANSRKKLMEARQKRQRPQLDDKVLADWNGLMISSFALASRVLDEPRYAGAAQSAAEFIFQNMQDNEGRLLHRYRDGEAGVEATLDDYAFLIYGLLDLYQADFDEKWLSESRRLFRRMRDEFWDAKRKGFYLTSKSSEALITRPKTDTDGALPSGNSIAALDALFLSRFTGESSYEETARDIFRAFSSEVSSQPTGYSQMLTALDFAIGPSYEIVFAAQKQDGPFLSMLKEIYLRFLPNKITLWDKIEKERPTVGGKTTVYVCQRRSCRAPVTDVEGLRKLLEKEP